MDLELITVRQVKNILVLTDFSACSAKALLYAINIARRHNSRLTLLHIVPPQPGLRQPARRKEALHIAFRQMKQLQFDLLSQGVLRDVHLQLLVKRGEHWPVTAKVLELQSTDVIVLGTHGRTGLKKVFLGSFAETIFRQAPCPVLTVGPSIPDGVVAEFPRHLLFPTDHSHASKSAEPYAYWLGRAPGAQLTLLRVVSTGLFEHGKPDSERLEEARKHLQATGLYAAWREEGIAPRATAEIGPKVETILRAARSTDAHLVIMGIWGQDNDSRKFGRCVPGCVFCALSRVDGPSHFSRSLLKTTARDGTCSCCGDSQKATWLI